MRHEPHVAMDPSAVPRSEGYTLRIDAETAQLVAHDESGVRHGLHTWQQWLDSESAIAVEVTDAPALAVRGAHLDLKFHAPQFDWLMGWLEQLAALKLNTLVVEYEDKFPFHHALGVADPSAWSPEQVRAFGERAASLGIEIVPLVQSIGHFEYVLRLDHYKSLREKPDDLSQLCPCRAGSRELVESLLSEVIAAHPHARHLHLGGDETAWLGYCPDCARRATELGGTVALYAEFIGSLCEWVLARGLRPVLWDDILRKEPRSVSRLPTGTIIMHWDYEAEGTPLAPAARESGAQESLLGGEFLVSPLSKTLPSYARYRAAGYEVWMAPLYAGGQLVPDVIGTARNCRWLAAEAARYGCEGLIGTQWSVLFTPPALARHGLATLADAAWNPLPSRDDALTVNRPDVATSFNRRFCRSVFGLPDETLTQALTLLETSRLYRPVGGFPTSLVEPTFVDPALIFPGEKPTHWIAAFFRPDWGDPVSRFTVVDAWHAKLDSLRASPERPMFEAVLAEMLLRAQRGLALLETLQASAQHNLDFMQALLAGARARVWRIEMALTDLMGNSLEALREQQPVLERALVDSYRRSLTPEDAQQLTSWLLAN